MRNEFAHISRSARAAGVDDEDLWMPWRICCASALCLDRAVKQPAWRPYRTNDYSVPTEYGHRQVLVKAYVDHIVIVCGCEIIAEHKRSYERSSTLITSNLPFDEWTEIFGSERLTSSLLDRITHHVNIQEMNADSYRLKQSRRKRA
jgi:hypothetical protein